MSIKLQVYAWILTGLAVLPGISVQAAEYPGAAQTGGYHTGIPNRWRPLDSTETERQTPHDNSSQAYTSGIPQYQDYTDTPYGLPRGVYRPVEERHIITPHHKGYRFRPLTPNEQVRVHKRNTDQLQEMSRARNDRRPVYTPRGADASAFSGQSGFRFRPDDRLPSMTDSPSRSYPPNPEFTELYPSNLFRPLQN
ncbi:MAG: hypothetical protein ABW076_07400 [Candidatus Thiodiazotropha sp.]